MKDSEVLFGGEVQFAGWKDSHTSGPMVTFWLQDSSQLETFRVMTARKGNTAGQRMMMALVEIGDDEEPVDQAPKDEHKGGALARLAGMWCQDDSFVVWMGLQHPEAWEDASGSDEHERCAEAVRILCGVTSRADLDHDEAAAAIFHNDIRVPYMESRNPL